MKRFISVFILLFVVFGVMNARITELDVHLNEKCTIYQCDSEYDVNALLKSKASRFASIGYCAYNPKKYDFDNNFGNTFYVYVYETSNGKVDWRVIEYTEINFNGVWLNRDLNDIWNREEIPKWSNYERSEFWEKQPEDIVPVYCEISDFRQTEPRTKVIAAGNSSFIGDIITEAGGTNIFPDINETYVYASEELVIERAPEIIILLKSGCITPNDIKNRKGWKNVPAVKNNRIYVIDDVPCSFLDIAQSTMTTQIQNVIKEYKK